MTRGASRGRPFRPEFDDADGVRRHAIIAEHEFGGPEIAQYFGDPFKPGPSRAHLVEPTD
jgi:hypothetical protein